MKRIVWILFILFVTLFVLIPLFAALGIPLLVPALVITLIYLKIKSPEIKGMMGERQVNNALQKLHEDYTVFADLYLPNGNGGTVQVDHIVTSPYGIFVIETKNYRGWIFGQEDKPNWTQVIYKRKEKLYNPIWQNSGHVKALKRYIENDHIAVHSIIVFTTRSTLKMKDNFRSARVIQTPQLIRTLREQTLPTIPYSDVEKINQALQTLVITDKQEKKLTKKRHIGDAKEKQRGRLQRIRTDNSGLSCPKCNGTLTKKSGKYGEFYGCSNFPKCQFTKTTL